MRSGNIKEKGFPMRPTRSDPQLDIDRIVCAAWKLVDDGGFDGLSTRKLATALGVKGPALYHHVGSMQELMGLMIAHVIREAMPETGPVANWKDWIREIAKRHRDVLLAHRDSGRIATNAAPSESMRVEIIPMFIEPLIRAGFTRQEALAANGALGSFILGYVIMAQQERHREFVASINPLERSFNFGIDALVEGMAQRLRQRAKTRMARSRNQRETSKSNGPR